MPRDPFVASSRERGSTTRFLSPRFLDVMRCTRNDIKAIPGYYLRVSRFYSVRREDVAKIAGLSRRMSERSLDGRRDVTLIVLTGEFSRKRTF